MVVSEGIFLDTSCFYLIVKYSLRYFYLLRNNIYLFFLFLFQLNFCRKNLKSFLKRYWPSGRLASIDIFGFCAGNSFASKLHSEFRFLLASEKMSCLLQM